MRKTDRVDALKLAERSRHRLALGCQSFSSLVFGLATIFDSRRKTMPTNFRFHSNLVFAQGGSRESEL